VKKILVISLIVFCLLAVIPVSAQEVETTGVVGIEKDVFIGICIAVAIVLQGMIVAYITKNPTALYDAYIQALKDKEVRSAAELAYMSSSLPVQEFVKLIKSGVIVVSELDIKVVDDIADPLAEFMDDITDSTSDEDDMV
jgi:hypothetical protein